MIVRHVQVRNKPFFVFSTHSLHCDQFLNAVQAERGLGTCHLGYLWFLCVHLYASISSCSKKKKKAAILDWSKCCAQQIVCMVSDEIKSFMPKLILEISQLQTTEGTWRKISPVKFQKSSFDRKRAIAFYVSVNFTVKYGKLPVKKCVVLTRYKNNCVNLSCHILLLGSTAVFSFCFLVFFLTERIYKSYRT